jgi:CelD/BcsL family acetyltransferase involved in cellulose biosynthesis
MSGRELEVRLYRGREGQAELYPSWQNLVANVRNQCFYHQPEWFHAFLSVYTDIAESIYFFGVFRGCKLVAVFPVQFHTRRKIFRIRVVSLPLTHQLYMTDGLISDIEDSSRIFEVFLDSIPKLRGRQWDVFFARGTLENSQISHCLDKLQRYSCVSNRGQACSLIHVLPYKDALKKMKPKLKQNLTRRGKRIGEMGTVEFSVETSPTDVTRVIDEFIDLEASGWKAGKGNLRGSVGVPLAIKLNANKLRFYRQVITSLAHKGVVELHCLRLDGRLIAARVWLVFNDCAYAIKTAYDERFGRFSPGMLTFDRAYQHQAEKGHVRYINPIYQQPSLDGWQATTLWYQNHVCFNNTIKGRLVSGAYSILAFLHKRIKVNSY